MGSLLVLGRRLRWTGEAVVGVWPADSLRWIAPSGADALDQQRQLMAASLAHGSERDGVPGQVQRDLIRLPGPITAGHSHDGQHRSINAA